ncbi:MAG: O-antigen ligase family protein [Gammaproteobacteria bacterium]|nr:O-antigen ligase family protein [Gammaproteobacteria bacterium]
MPDLLEYRVPISATLLVLSLASMFVLTSQSGSSLPTYFLAAYTVLGFRRWSGLWLNWVFLLSVAVSVYIAMTSFWSTPFDARNALSQFSRALLGVCFVVAVAEGFRVDWFRVRMTAALALCGGAAAAAAVLLFVAVPPEDGRLNGLGQLDAHIRAALCFGVSLVCAIAWMTETRSATWRAVAGVLAVFLAVAVALSNSRNAWVTVPFGCLVFLISRYAPERGLPAACGAAFALVAAAVALALWFEPSRDALLSRGDSYRPDIWADILRRVMDHGPWFGNGVLTDDNVTVASLVLPHPHNMYLAVLFQGGVAGLALFLLLVALALRTLLAHLAEPEAKLALGILAIGLPAWLLDGYELVDKIGWTWMLFWFPVAVAVGLGSRRGLEDARRFSGG